MDEIVWAINPKHDSLESLVFYFEKFALDFLGTAGIRCRLEMPADFPAWNPGSEARHNLFLGLKEALNNAVRHSGADTVTVGLEIDGERGRLFVRDNGRGFAAVPSGAAGGNGLANLRERLARLGGRCEITSRPGGGTEVSLEFPRRTPAEEKRS
jgi:signal transduction histidine kinase